MGESLGMKKNDGHLDHLIEQLAALEELLGECLPAAMLLIVDRHCWKIL